MALLFRPPSYCPYRCGSYYNRAAPGLDFFDDLWKEMAFACEEQAKTTQGPVKIAFLPLNQYKPDEVSMHVDSEKITLHGQHRSESEDGFEKSEFKKIIKLPEGVDPTTVTSRAIQNGQVLLIEGTKSVEKKAKADDGKFAVKLDFHRFNPEDIKVQLRGRELAITAKHKSEENGVYLSRDYSRRILLPNDADLSSVTSCLSKEGLLTIEVSCDPALLPSERSVDITMEADEAQLEEEATTTN